MAENRDPIFERFEIRMEEMINITKVRLLGAAKCAFGVRLEKFPQMEFFDRQSGVVKAPGIVIGDNFSDSSMRDCGVFVSPYDKTAAKIIPHRSHDLVTIVFSGEKLFLHENDRYEPDLEAAEAPQDFYLAFARAVMNAIEKEAARIKRSDS